MFSFWKSYISTNIIKKKNENPLNIVEFFEEYNLESGTGTEEHREI